MKIATANDMRLLERRAAEAGLPSERLMENAGLAVAQEIERLSGSVKGQYILVLLGPGNNGGDGLVVGRHLHDWGARVRLFPCSPRVFQHYQWQPVKERGIPFSDVSLDPGLADLQRELHQADVVIDALFGTGKVRPLEGPCREALIKVSLARKEHPAMKLVALDLPSGMDADTGTVDPFTPTCDMTVTLGYPKQGLFLFPGAEMAGKVVVADIGIPAHLAQDLPVDMLSSSQAASLVPSRPLHAHKGTFGKLMVVAGSANYVGAAYLACMGAYRVGAGLVALATGESLHPILAAKLTEAIHFPLPETGDGISPEAASGLIEQSRDYQALLVGCGLGQASSTQRFLQELLFDLPQPPPPLVLDADALNWLATIPQWWKRLPGNAILTPHPGELSRLTGLSAQEVHRDRVGLARRMAGEWGKTLVLKGAFTVIATPEGKARVSPEANPALASAGTGDVLAGAISGLAAQGLTLADAAALGVYLHSAAGARVRETLGDAGGVASDLLPLLPLAIKELKPNAP